MTRRPIQIAEKPKLRQDFERACARIPGNVRKYFLDQVLRQNIGEGDYSFGYFEGRRSLMVEILELTGDHKRIIEDSSLLKAEPKPVGYWRRIWNSIRNTGALS